jgi:hypothetical protein
MAGKLFNNYPTPHPVSGSLHDGMQLVTRTYCIYYNEFRAPPPPPPPKNFMGPLGGRAPGGGGGAYKKKPQSFTVVFTCVLPFLSRQMGESRSNRVVDDEI